MGAAMSFNDRIIEEFRANGGQVGGHFHGQPLALVHHIGARTGIKRVSPLAFQEVEDGFAVFASKGGADENPAWYYNLLANPRTTIELGTETVDVVAREADETERLDIWARQVAARPNFGEYERKTKRDHIPVVLLERA
jgi:deazaflavin-dependent oxidoreductase (nitroreductase family)